MTKEIKIPQITEDADSATVAEIYVKAGDEVKKGDDLIAVDSDKASVDIPNEEADGTVKEVKVSEGDEVKVGDVILILEISEDGGEEEEGQDESESDEESSDDKDSGKAEEAEKTEEEADSDQQEEKTSSAGEEKEKESSQEKDEPSEEADDRDPSDIPAAPLARQFARELGIDLEDLKDDDPEQRITREDVMAYAKKVIQSGGDSGGGSKKYQGVEPIELPDFSQYGETEREPLSGIRTAVAKNTTKSWQNIPHVTQHDKADLTELQNFRERLAEKDQKLSITALFAKICVEALQKFPRFNSSLDLDNRELILKKYYNIGIAADTDDGLLMPVIRNADQKSLQELNDELGELAKKARDRKLKPEEMKGGNFTISNLGGIGGTAFTPVIFPPQVAILGISKPQVEARWIGDEFVPADICTLSLSYDHRVIDGADAARFLAWICDVIEEPFNLL